MEYCTAKRVCELLGISRATLWRWENECEDFPQPLRIGKVIRYSIPDICEFAYVRSGRRREVESGLRDLRSEMSTAAQQGGQK